jgi:hydrogenase maturation protein HypF
MKLESASRGGADRLNVEPEMEGEVIRTTNMVRMIYEQRAKSARSDLALAAHSYLARALADAAVRIAEQEDIMTVGFSGGVALNEIISVMIRDAISDAGLRFVSNVAVPPGDGGVSFGQAYIASLQ